MARVAANGIEIHYRIDGEGPETVMLIAGLGDDIASWDLQMPALLRAGYRVVRFDNRGIGHSSKPAGPYTTRMLAADAKALADALGLSRFHLVGVSMGGMIGQHYAIDHGADLASLTLVCTYAAPGPYCTRLFTLWREMAQTKGVAFALKDVLLRCFTPDFFVEREKEAEAYEAAYADAASAVPAAAFLGQIGALLGHDTRAALSAIAAPTLVVAGDGDVLIPSSLSRALAAAVPKAEWAPLPGGHMMLWEHPQEFDAALLGFLARHRA